MLLKVRPDQTSNKQSISQPNCASVSRLMSSSGPVTATFMVYSPELTMVMNDLVRHGEGYARGFEVNRFNREQVRRAVPSMHPPSRMKPRTALASGVRGG